MKQLRSKESIANVYSFVLKQAVVVLTARPAFWDRRTGNGINLYEKVLNGKACAKSGVYMFVTA
jgi:hypothetical protein